MHQTKVCVGNSNCPTLEAVHHSSQCSRKLPRELHSSVRVFESISSMWEWEDRFLTDEIKRQPDDQVQEGALRSGVEISSPLELKHSQNRCWWDQDGIPAVLMSLKLQLFWIISRGKHFVLNSIRCFIRLFPSTAFGFLLSVVLMSIHWKELSVATTIQRSASSVQAMISSTMVGFRWLYNQRLIVYKFSMTIWFLVKKS